MLKKIILLWLCCSPLLATAQLVLNAQLPAAGFVQKDQLWNLVLVNNSADILDVTIQLDVQDQGTGQVVLSAATGNLLVGKGVKNIAAKDLQPILYNYNVPELSKNYLPMGSYVACYQVIGNGRKDGPLAQECIRFNIDPLSPPLLSSPADKAVIESPYPQFSWIPPSPFEMFTDLSYDLLLTEVSEGQSASEAIQYNTPVYNRYNIAQPFESYPASFTKLDTGKIYAWQVIARNGLSYAAKTEVWTFKVKSIQNMPAPAIEHYVLLDNSVAGTYFLQKEVLGIKYYSFNPNYTTSALFTDESGKLIKEVKIKVTPGDNFIDFDISHGFQHGKIYKVTIADIQNKPHSLTFSIKN